VAALAAGPGWAGLRRGRGRREHRRARPRLSPFLAGAVRPGLR
jgi:hypothetical protein